MPVGDGGLAWRRPGPARWRAAGGASAAPSRPRPRRPPVTAAGGHGVEGGDAGDDAGGAVELRRGRAAARSRTGRSAVARAEPVPASERGGDAGGRDRCAFDACRARFDAEPAGFLHPERDVARGQHVDRARRRQHRRVARGRAARRAARSPPASTGRTASAVGPAGVVGTSRRSPHERRRRVRRAGRGATPRPPVAALGPTVEPVGVEAAVHGVGRASPTPRPTPAGSGRSRRRRHSAHGRWPAARATASSRKNSAVQRPSVPHAGARHPLCSRAQVIQRRPSHGPHDLAAAVRAVPGCRGARPAGRWRRSRPVGATRLRRGIYMSFSARRPGPLRQTSAPRTSAADGAEELGHVRRRRVAGDGVLVGPPLDDVEAAGVVEVGG